MALNKIGGIIMLISLFFPAIIILLNEYYVMIWMFGLAVASNPTKFGGGFVPDFVGISLFVVILILGLLCIIKKSKSKVFGILSIVFIGVYYIWWFIIGRLILVMASGSGVSVLIIPFIGFFGIIIGSILYIVLK